VDVAQRKNESFRSGERAVAKKECIVRYSAEELAAKRKRGETRSDWARAAAMTQAEIEADIASDPDEAGMVVDWDSVSAKLPKPKADLHMRIDHDVLEFFRKTGRGYQTRTNAVLRSYVQQARHK
jgi:uncharacterized protein (DUF4415 family)